MSITRHPPQKNKLADTVFFGTTNTSVLDKLCAFLLVLSPILQHYVGIYRSAGFTILLVLSPYLLLKVLKKFQMGRINTTHLTAFLMLFFFQFFKMISHTVTTSKIMYGLFMLICFFTVVCECVNLKYFIRYATYIATLAGICLIVQYILYYLGGFHLQMVPTDLLLPENEAWILGAKTGTASITGKLIDFYRPSAFFLEPSHMMLFCFPVLSILLLSSSGMQAWKMRAAVIITLGIALSTSGMGIAVCIGIWAVYFLLYRGTRGQTDRRSLFKKLFTVKNVAVVILLLAFLIIAYSQIGFFRNAVDRVFTEDNTNAIDGRVRLAKMLVEDLSGQKLFMGVTDDVSDIDFNLSGFFATLYKFGLVGIVLSYLFYVRSLLKLRGAYFWMSLIIIVLSYFTAHTHGTFYMLYFILFLMEGYHPNHDPKKQARKRKRKQQGHANALTGHHA